MDLQVFSVVVVGAGVAGLVSARELSKHFADVLLVEAGPNTGGRVQEVTRRHFVVISPLP